MRSLIQVQPNLLQRCPKLGKFSYQIWGKSCQPTCKQSVEIISCSYSSLSFCTLRIFDHNLWMHTHIKLKRGTCEGLIKMHLHTLNLIKIYGVIINFLPKKRSKVCHTYKVNCWKELDETWDVSGVTIVGVPFVVWKESRKKTTGMIQKPTGVKIYYMIEFVN